MAGYLVSSRADRRQPVPPVFYGDGEIIIRSIAWHDIPSLLRHRQRILCLDNEYHLTHGSPLGFSALISRMDPLNGSLTGIAAPSNGRSLLAGQVNYNIGERSARMIYLLPDEFPRYPELIEIIEYLCYHAGCMGAIHLLSEVPETHSAFELFRQANFSVYCWQNIYRFPTNAPSRSRYKALWSRAETQDEIPVRGLYQTVVPPLVQAAEPFNNNFVPRLVARQRGEIMAFVECSAGPQGIFLKPVVHPSVEDVSDLLSDLIFHFQNLGRPVYFPVRSFQSWISDTLAELGGENSSRYAQMVKHLAASVPAENNSLLRSRLETRNVEPSASIVQKMVEKQ